MTFIPPARLDARAAELWRTHRLEIGFDADDLVDKLDLGLVWDDVPENGGPVILGLLDPNDRVVVLNQRHLAELEANGGRLRRFTVAHEIGHWLLHADAARSGTLSLLQDGRVWCRTGSRDPVERQADMFAGRLLIPQDLLRAELPGTDWHGWPIVYRLADRFVVSATAMMVRLSELGWAHRDSDDTPMSGRPPVEGQAQLPFA